MYFVMKIASNNQWYWVLKAANHEPIAVSETYYNRADCLHAIHLVQSSSGAKIYE